MFGISQVFSSHKNCIFKSVKQFLQNFVVNFRFLTLNPCLILLKNSLTFLSLTELKIPFQTCRLSLS